MIGIGIIGAGYFGAEHAGAIAENAGTRLVASCRPDIEGALAFAARFGGRAHTRVEALLAEPTVDAVVIASPHHLHAEHAIAAARAGKAMLLEKPMAPSTAECDRILAAVGAAGVPLLVGHSMRFARVNLVARDMIEQGVLGPVRHGLSRLTKLWMEPNRQDWHLSQATGGGMLMTAGLHALDRLLFLIGRRPTQVSALVETAHHAQEADDCALLLLRFEGGGGGLVTSLGYRDGARVYDCEIVGRDGVLVVDGATGLRHGRGGTWHDIAGSTEPNWHGAALAREIEALRACVADGVAPPVTGADGRLVVAVIEAAMRSGRERREIAIE